MISDLFSLLTFFSAPLATIVVLFGIWLWDNKGHQRITKAIVPEYLPPDHLSVTEIGVLFDNRLDYFDLSAELYDLILKNYIQKEGHKLLLKATQKEISRLSSIQKQLLVILFEDFHLKEVELHKLNALTKSKILDIKRYIYDELTQKGYYPLSPLKQRETYFSLAYALMFFAVLIIIITQFQPHWFFIFSLLISALLVAFFAENHAKKTLKGYNTYYRILGFKHFIKTAETDRIRYLLNHEPKNYLQILAFAYLFGVIKKWQIKDKETDTAMLTNQFKNLKLYNADFSESFTKANSILWLGRFIIFSFLAFGRFSLTLAVNHFPSLKKHLPKEWIYEKFLEK